MNTQKYVSFRRGRHLRLKRRVTGAVIIVFVALFAMFIIGKLTANSDEYRQKVSLVEENRVLREQVASLTERVAELEGTVSEQESYISSLPAGEPEAAPEENEASDTDGFEAETPRSE